ncbi:CDGSH iron-sulfur domain-containing protein [Tropicimonas isoalkanivorans]|uniref:Uncharacterized Fe-S cluster protein YjdI n=1 Tax=Tropicimonas isoalkanivorans TaxID=441112 RepID=A0A1I1M7R8_9RHOB|nr:CDGSH iron-sulfur domain-containing protein [Tropicimonas isoalkanivorans]SFC78623.1 Uncharacterized Fe-S cluster protein YjdI [Tropicimonas isoalkanivorans]
MSDDSPHIEERENGPLVAKGITRMCRTDGTELEVKPSMALCRCGGSSNKPYCDGTHAKKGFESRSGTPEGKDRVLSYDGREVTVFFNPRICGHVYECGRTAPEVFDSEQRPWVQPDNGTLEQIEAAVRACPSGALRMARTEIPEHRLPDRAQITVEEDGPYWVEGVAPPVPLDAEGATAAKYVLCRCGMSGNKPYCDGTHHNKGWKADE